MVAPPRRDPWYRRLLRSALTWSGIGPSIETPSITDYIAGWDFAFGAPTSAVEARLSMETLGENEWVYAAVSAIAADLSILPIRVYRGRGPKRVEVPDHPVLQLIEQPSSRVDGRFFRQQVYTSRILSGSAMWLKIYDSRKRVVSWLYLPPDRTQIEPSADGQPSVYRYNSLKRYDWQAVYHVRAPSWKSDPRTLMGQGIVEALKPALTAFYHHQMRMQQAAQAGKPEILVTPDMGDGGEALMALGTEKLKQIREQVAQVFRENTGGASVLGLPMKVEKLTWSPSDLQSLEVLAQLRSAILACAGVPPARLGLETTNYATAREQMKGYWANTLQAEASLFDSAMTMNARADYGDPDLFLEHDFSQIEWLQEGRTEALARVLQHIAADPDVDRVAAYQAEGLVYPGAAGSAGAKGTPDDTADTEVDRPEPADKGAPRLRIVREVAPPRKARPSRASRWQRWQRERHAPSTRRIARAARATLRAQAQRAAERVPGAGLREASAMYQADPEGVRRDLLGDILAHLFPPTEAAELAAGMQDSIRATLAQAFTAQSKDLGRPVTWKPADLDTATRWQTAQMVTRVDDTTRIALRGLVDDALANGWSTNELQRAILGLPEFGASRALRIAQTEATRNLDAGARQAWHDIQEQHGVKLGKRWISARDSAVRLEHRVLDGQLVPLDGVFTIEGETATGPGGFASARLSVNCRCCTVAEEIP